MNNIEEWLLAYETDVNFPDVSGMEHLDMLLTRSQIANEQTSLTVEQQTRLLEADRLLYQKATQFYRAIARIADLAAWRKHAQAPLSHWWWYLDVLAHVPFTRAQRMAA